LARLENRSVWLFHQRQRSGLRNKEWYFNNTVNGLGGFNCCLTFSEARRCVKM
jgi:hypothetical protein